MAYEFIEYEIPEKIVVDLVALISLRQGLNDYHENFMELRFTFTQLLQITQDWTLLFTKSKYLNICILILL